MLNNNSHAKGNIMQRKYNIITLFTVVALLFSACQVSPEKMPLLAKMTAHSKLIYTKKLLKNYMERFQYSFRRTFFAQMVVLNFKCVLTKPFP